MARIPMGDNTLERERIKRYRELLSEYEQIKRKEHLSYRTVKSWSAAREIDIKSFHKYRNRFVHSKGKDSSLLPQKRGPRYKTGKPIRFIENKVIALRNNGINRYEISAILSVQLHKFAPSPSGVYNICKRYGLNVLGRKQKENKRKIIKQVKGELGHIDVHHLSKYVIRGKVGKLYLVALQDDYSRLTWAELLPDSKALTVMFGAIKCFNALRSYFDITF